MSNEKPNGCPEDSPQGPRPIGPRLPGYESSGQPMMEMWLKDDLSNFADRMTAQQLWDRGYARVPVDQFQSRQVDTNASNETVRPESMRQSWFERQDDVASESTTSEAPGDDDRLAKDNEEEQNDEQEMEKQDDDGDVSGVLDQNKNV